MPRPGIGDLPRVPRQFDPAYAPESKFETLTDARDEDRKRARSLLRYRPNSPAKRKRAKQLARKLARTGSYPKSPASSRYMRKMRRRIIGHLWKLFPSNPAIRVTTVTIIPKGWAVRANALHRVNPAKLMAQFRTDLNRAGGGKATGWGCFFLHGEFEPVRRLYVPHIHGVVLGDMIDVIDNLAKGKDGKERKKYKSTRTRDPIDGVAQRIFVSRKPLSRMPDPLSYILKSYWPARAIGTVGVEDDGIGKLVRTRKGQRIPEPFHAEWLLWMNRWKIADFSLLYGLRVTKTGITTR